MAYEEDPFEEVEFSNDIDVSGAPISLVVDSFTDVHLVFDENSSRSVRLLMQFSQMQLLKRLIDEQLQLKR